eukprot:2399200-Rhodomonas_salina.1
MMKTRGAQPEWAVADHHDGIGIRVGAPGPTLGIPTARQPEPESRSRCAQPASEARLTQARSRSAGAGWGAGPPPHVRGWWWSVGYCRVRTGILAPGFKTTEISRYYPGSTRVLATSTRYRYPGRDSGYLVATTTGTRSAKMHLTVRLVLEQVALSRSTITSNTTSTTHCSTAHPPGPQARPSRRLPTPTWYLRVSRSAPRLPQLLGPSSSRNLVLVAAVKEVLLLLLLLGTAPQPS